MGEGDGADSAPNKTQPDGAPAVATTSSGGEAPAKKQQLARQLDFTGLGAASSGSVAMPVVPPRPQLPAVTVPQSQPRPQVMGLPVPVPVPPQPTVPSVRPVKPDSPKSRPRPNIDGKDGTPKKQKQCNCKHSRCLKLYCECFASGIYCDGCNCNNCCNNVENEGARRDAVEATLERNPNAFRPKIASSPHGPRDSREEAGELVVLAKHNKGCHCKKSGCLKKYCECFQANILCSENCKCVDCKNFEGSEERQALFHGDHTNNMAYLQHAANAAITGAIGSSGYLSSPAVSKKRKGQELFFGNTAKDPSAHRTGQYPQTNNLRPPVPSSSSVPVARHGTAGLGPSKFIYRSLLADIIQTQDLKELCSVLVVVAEEAAKAHADQKNAAEKQAEAALGTTTEDKLQSQNESDTQKAVTDDCSTADQADKISPEDSNFDGVDGPKGRPMSPGTLALMCDEQDTMFMSAASPNGLMGDGCNASSQLPNGQGMTEVYAEQERIVLAKFRGCLNMLITRGELKEAECASLARSEAAAQKEQIGNGTTNPRMETGSRQGPISNGVANTAVPPTARTSQMGTAAGLPPSSVPPPTARTSQMGTAAGLRPSGVPPPTARPLQMGTAAGLPPSSVPPPTTRPSQMGTAAGLRPSGVPPPTARPSQMSTAAGLRPSSVPPPTARTSQMGTAAGLRPSGVPPPTARPSQMGTAAGLPPSSVPPPTARTSQMGTAAGLPPSSVPPPAARTSQMTTAAGLPPSTVPSKPPSMPGNGGNKPKA